MKRFLIRACAKIGRFFWSWGFLKFCLWTVTLIILFYAEEDWRGARAWTVTKAKWEARGETFDFNKLIPPPVPDDQNLAAIPLFKMEPDLSSKNKVLAPLTLDRDFKNNTVAHPLPSLGNWEGGKTADMEKVRRMVAGEYAEAFPGKPLPNDLSAQFAELYPFLGDLREAIASRPACRFEQNYKFEPPYNLYLPLITAQIRVAQYLTCDAVITLAAGKPNQALDDIKVNSRLAEGLGDQPILISGLCSIAMVAINFSAVYEGLTHHAWNDVQLADLDNELAKIDFLSDYRHDLRGEAIGMAIPNIDNLKLNHSGFATSLGMLQTKSRSRDFFPIFWPDWPDGWIDLLKAQVVNFDLSATNFIDPKSRSVYPKSAEEFADEIAQQHGWDVPTFWAVLAGVAVGPVNGAVKKFSEMQVWVDEARLACALERYRLVHNAYPDSLDALVPAYAAELPHDIFNGQPYHYRPRPDGTYLLYSIGWNQTDDGGKIVYEKDHPSFPDLKQGDWVWPTAQPAPTK